MHKLLPRFALAICISLSLAGCDKIAEAQTGDVNADTAEAELLSKTLQAHGWDAAQAPGFEFTFRDRRYWFARFGENWVYKRTTEQGDSITVDELSSATGYRQLLNGQPAFVEDTMAVKYSNSVNSVIYFATLPDKLTDPAVNLTYDGEQTVRGAAYRLLRVHFDVVGGGKDHDDNFLYWINQETGEIDYLAYDYLVDGGGVRFRSAYNKRRIRGILFQDYVNYSAPVGTSLNALAGLWESDELKELSRIELENISPVHVTWD